MKPTDTLKHEHQIILLVLGAASAEARRPEQLDLGKAAKMADFFRNFADKCHHAKEEGYLFPALVQRGLPQEEGPISVMLSEHNQGRALVRAMFEELEKETPNRSALAAHLESFAALLEAHIGKEDNVLFPMADQILTDEDQTRLEAEFERVEAEEIGEGVHEQYHQLAHELTAH